ncbi:MAG TPA: 50S ribosomal protein L9 [Candidatus Andersenbacteria bacterium]|nr:50S ribosomal protein L9 [Candidatus Andersenbacteria bacterium]
MSKKISIILLEDVHGLGKSGQIVAAAEGYARNFLFPQGRAALADEQARSAAQAKAAKQTAQAQENLAALQAQATALESTELVLHARLKEDQHEEIYGSITARQISEALQAQAALEVAARDVILPEPLTRLGTYKIPVNLSSDIEAVVTVTIVADEP